MLSAFTFESGREALSWIIDTILARRKEKKDIKKEKWLQVSEYLERVATMIDDSIKEFKSSKVPHVQYAYLTESLPGFINVVIQIYDERDPTVKKMVDAFKRVIHLIDTGDGMVVDQPAFNSPQAVEIAEDLYALVGKFRALAATLKAMA
jgi:hypothetical protein